MQIEIKPAPRSNPEGLESLPWNIWKDGINTNVKPTKSEAEQAAHNLTHRASPSSVDIDAPPKHYMDVFRPRGAPEIGSRVKFYVGDISHIGKVTEYLSTQFIVEYMNGKRKRVIVLRTDDEWTVCV